MQVTFGKKKRDQELPDTKIYSLRTLKMRQILFK